MTGSSYAPTMRCAYRAARLLAGATHTAGTALPVGDPAGGSLDLKSDTSLLGLVNTVVK
jgi:hypothetical protein